MAVVLVDERVSAAYQAYRAAPSAERWTAYQAAGRLAARLAICEWRILGFDSNLERRDEDG